MNKLFPYGTFFLALLCTTRTLASEYPHSGITYNTKEASSLAYSCEKNGNESLKCEFIQTSVKKNAEPVDLHSDLFKAESMFSTRTATGSEDCNAQKNWMNVLLGKEPAPTKEIEENLRNLTEIERMDWIKFANAMADFCTLKTEESHLNQIHLEQDKASRTCIVSSHTFKQNFHLVHEGTSQVEVWLAESKPSGPCSVIRQSRFEPANPGISKPAFWKYIVMTTVDGKQGSLSCHTPDEGESVYDRKDQDRALGCDYIKLAAPPEVRELPASFNK